MKKKKAKQREKFRPFSDPLKRHWEIWDLNGEKVDIVADFARFSDGVLDLFAKKWGVVGEFLNFRAAMQHAHGNFGFSHYWVNDGILSHVIEANRHAWNIDGKNVFAQIDSETKTERIVAVFPHAAWWLQRDSRMWPDK